LRYFFTEGKVSRREGILLFGYYPVYSLYLIHAAYHHDALPVFSAVLLYFAIPLTMDTLIVLAVYAMRSRKQEQLFYRVWSSVEDSETAHAGDGGISGGTDGGVSPGGSGTSGGLSGGTPIGILSGGTSGGLPGGISGFSCVTV